jgi:sugar (pentulose or hexulose) kinase
VTQGIHDSNANYLPYLAQRRQSDQFADFLLNSTGTWCVLMRESPTSILTHDEAQAKVLFNLDVLGRPVRTCIFPAGMEYDTFRAFTREKDASDEESVRRVIAQRRLFVIPGVLPDSSAFPGAVARVVDGDKVYTLEQLRRDGGTPLSNLGQDYYAALNLALAMTTRRLLDWSALNNGTSIFVEGGFSRNKSYCELLAALCPRQRINRTNLKEGTSFGAAVTAWMLAEKLSLDEMGHQFSIQTSPFTAPELPGLDEYKAEFLRVAQGV